MEGQEDLWDEGTPSLSLEEEQPLYLEALQGVNSFLTIRVTGKVGSHPIHMLIDSRSAYNFLDAKITKKLRCELLRIPPIVVVVVNGAQLKCQTMCKGFS